MHKVCAVYIWPVLASWLLNTQLKTQIGGTHAGAIYYIRWENQPACLKKAAQIPRIDCSLMQARETIKEIGLGGTRITRPSC